jgi:hypothetical protein
MRAPVKREKPRCRRQFLLSNNEKERERMRKHTKEDTRNVNETKTETPVLGLNSPLMRRGTDPGWWEEMRALVSSDVDVADGVGELVAEVRHGVRLTPLHVRTDGRGFWWRLHACMPL